MPLATFVIPTSRPPQQLIACLDAIAKLELDPQDLQVAAVINGVLAPRDFGRSYPFQLVVESIAQPNISAAKNRALQHARGEWVFLINDDTYVQPDFVRMHLEMHERLSRPAMVLGRSIWKTWADQTIFDRLVAETSMIFFYDRLQPGRPYNFRHAWNLNLSVRRRYLEAMPFDEQLSPMFYEDIEWAYRVQQVFELDVYYAPDAISLHDHRYTLDGYLNREVNMGQAAPRLWRANPDCFRAVYGADLDAAYLDYCRAYIERDGRSDESLQLLRELTARPAAALSGTPQEQMLQLQLLYQAHLPLKRRAFRRGLLDAMHATALNVEPDAEPAAAVFEETI
ncbi:Glycosyl transferase family 2 [Phycisphaerae bacterium RAS1]|nr:Glycosyl transferase family 2 [Phycisphaerae bacterium RAS1]